MILIKSKFLVKFVESLNKIYENFGISTEVFFEGQ